MRLNAPKKITFWIALIVAVIGVVAKLITIPFLGFLTTYSFLIVVIAFVLLALGNYVKGL